MKYLKDKEGKIFSFRVEQDEYPWDVRYDQDGNIGTMMCWWNRYELGDYKENKYSSPEEFLNDLVRKNISDNKIINYIKKGKAKNKLELKYNRSSREWELLGYYYLSLFGEKHNPKFDVITSAFPITYLVDDMIDALSMDDKWELLKSVGFYYMPLFIYEHGGLTMSTSSYSCSWDSGQAGWIYTTKERIINCGGKILSEKGNYIKITNHNWKEAAHQWLKSEVELYDMQLTGSVYGYILDELVDAEEDSWDENVDSCWGYYSNKWGSELEEEIISDTFGNYYSIFETLEDAIAA